MKEGPGFYSSQENGDFCYCFLVHPDRPWGSCSFLCIWLQGLLPLGLKRQRSEITHLLPSSAEFKNVWSCTSTPMRLNGLDRKNVASLFIILN